MSERSRITTRSGIYKILNNTNNKLYIGSAVNLYLRWQKHKSDFRKNRHDNSYMQNAWNKYGENSFVFEVIEFVDDTSKLIEREQHWIDETKCYIRKIGYNIRRNAENNLGMKHSEETKRKISKNRKGKRIPEEAMQRALQTRKENGYTHSEETRKKISESQKGRIMPEDLKKKLIAIHTGSKKGERPQEVKDKISKANKGRVRSDVQGENCHNAKLTDKKVIEIKLRLSNGEKVSMIAEDYNINPRTIRSIRQGKSWKHILPELDLSNVHKISEHTKEEVIKLISEGINMKEISKLIGISYDSVKKIKRNEVKSNT